ncbi:MAG TPA: phage tail sheath C-terminal domain-containing protein [Gemmatimonadaceae bacterium]|nr:phage tail sheath C-terminal domain-containing protein [Gemmatimonadaceae bacterium]
MPPVLTYPGVYIEEIPSGVRTITGVATSITAFVGRAMMGPINEPVVVNSFGDFERQFGGLGVAYPMSYAIRDFYLNGGSQALVVRVYRMPATAADAKSTIAIDDMALEARTPGTWGKMVRAKIDVDIAPEALDALPANEAQFNLSVRLGDTTEKFYNLTVSDTARRIDRVLEAESSIVRWKGDWASTTHAVPATLAALTARKNLVAAQKANPPVPANIAAAQTAYDDAKKALYDAVTKAEMKLAAARAANPQVPGDIANAEAELTAALGAMKGDDGGALDQATYEGSKADKTGLYALERADLFNLLCIPPDTRNGDVPPAVYQTAMAYCVERRAMLIVDSPAAWSRNPNTAAADAVKGLPDLGLSGNAARNAALYFPRLREADPLREGQIDTFVPCGAVAGVMARTDSSRGVWKAPAGLEAAVNGIRAFNVNLNDPENGMLNPLGINCMRAFPVNGRVVWGARTLRGADQLADEYKYVPVRRTALFIEESLYRGTQWVVFEPNDEPLWAQIRLNVGAFMNDLFRQGAFQGTTPRDAYFVKCDKETTTQNDINKGVVNIVVGFAPLKPAEFVVIKLQQIAGQIQT